MTITMASLPDPVGPAETRAVRSADPAQFRVGFRAGRAASATEDTDGRLRALLAQDDTAVAAGYLEGLAAGARARMGVHAVNCRCPHCRYRRRCWERRVELAAASRRRSRRARG
ncbi:hypothetical protein ABZ769_28145 [Streptomyces olivoreticuli]